MSEIIQLPYQDQLEDGEAFRERLHMWRRLRGWRNHPVPLIPDKQRSAMKDYQERIGQLPSILGKRA